MLLLSMRSNCKMRTLCIRIEFLNFRRLSNLTIANIVISTHHTVKGRIIWSIAGKIGSVDILMTINQDLWWVWVSNKGVGGYRWCQWRSRDKLILIRMKLCKRVKNCSNSIFMTHIKVIITRKMIWRIRIISKAAPLKIVESSIIVPIKNLLINP